MGIQILRHSLSEKESMMLAVNRKNLKIRKIESPNKVACVVTILVLSCTIFFLFFFSIWLDVPHLTNEHRTQDCIAS